MEKGNASARQESRNLRYIRVEPSKFNVKARRKREALSPPCLIAMKGLLTDLGDDTPTYAHRNHPSGVIPADWAYKQSLNDRLQSPPSRCRLVYLQNLQIAVLILCCSCP